MNMGVLVSALMAGTAITYGASMQQNRGVAWADNVCSATQILCSSPGWLALLTIILAILYFYRRSINT
jgi:hypothetical protein